MSAKLIWDNLVTYSLQIGLLVGLAAFVPALLRLRLPGAKLAYWQILLATCLLLPAVRPWHQEVISANVQVTTTVLAVAPPSGPAVPHFSPAQIALALLSAGAAIRLGWLAVGLWRLRRYRRQSRPADGLCRISDQVVSPVTFGFRRPVILLPARFPALDQRMQDAILCHETLHVERRDWLFTLIEELVRSIFWFHPAIWWLLGEIQLAREQAVDREVVRRTQARDTYVDTLLAIAGAGAQPDLAPAPLFLRKRHLKQRVVSILKEVRMSKTRWISVLAASVGILVAACWFVTATFPLAASPQVVTDSEGVTVDLGGATLMHRAPVAYPVAARNGGVQGLVSVEVKLDAAGSVIDARVLSGPDELRKTVIQSVLQWHFTAGAAGTTRVVNVNFQAPPAGSRPAVMGAAVGSGPRGGVFGSMPPASQEARERDLAAALEAQAAQLRQQQPTPENQAALKENAEKIATLARNIQASRQAQPIMPARTIRSITVIGLSDQATADLLSKLPVHQGDTFSAELSQRTMQVLKEFDEHLTVSSMYVGSGEETLTILAPGAPAPPPQIKIGGSVQQTKLIKQPRPVYPPEAKMQRVQGVVRLQAVIAKDGTVKSLDLIEGDPLLAPAAMDAVKQWVYQTTLLNGNPVEVMTQIDVNFTLSQ